MLSVFLCLFLISAKRGSVLALLAHSGEGNSFQTSRLGFMRIKSGNRAFAGEHLDVTVVPVGWQQLRNFCNAFCCYQLVVFVSNTHLGHLESLSHHCIAKMACTKL